MAKIIVIGGGPAGAMAAIAAAGQGCEVHLYEKNEKIGKKLYITGKGRCNVTNNCSPEEFLQAVCVNRKFLYSAGYGFTSQDVMDFFEKAGLRLKTERGNRVFPVSDHSSDVIAALNRSMRERGVAVHLDCEVKEILTEEGVQEKTDSGVQELSGASAKKSDSEVQDSDGNSVKKSDSGVQDSDGNSVKKPDSGIQELSGASAKKSDPGVQSSSGTSAKSRKKKDQSGSSRVMGVRLASGEIVCADAVIVATGGISYRTTGSTGDGYRFAQETGHHVTELSPSLVPLEIREDYPKKLQGLSLKNVEVTICDGNRELYSGFGEMMFTHFGVTGPLILTASTVIQKKLREHPLAMKINLKPALDEQQLDARFLREFDAAKNKQIKNVLGNLYPAKLVPVMLERCEIEPDKAVNHIAKAERQKLLEMTRDFPLTVTALRDYNEAVVTRGGVSVKEIQPQTMESRLVRGLYFAGEVLDLDAVTGGYNLQIAWATGYASGMGAAGKLIGDRDKKA